MTDAPMLTEVQMRRMAPYFPRSRGRPRVDDRRVLSGIVFVIRNGLRWRDAPAVYGPPKTLYNRWVRWSRAGVFSRIFAGLAAEAGPAEQLMIDATHLKAHRTAASLRKGGTSRAASDGRKAVGTRSSTLLATSMAAPACSCSPKARSATIGVPPRCCPRCHPRPC
jgi:transposase